jgi:Uma2 family endonuclease
MIFMSITTPLISLEEFLQLPETEPVSEYINGEMIPKTMPKSKHSRLQIKICNAINAVTEAEKIAYAFPELRCSFAGRSIVSDVAVFRWEQIEFDQNGEPLDDVYTPPDWIMEILSPEQSPNRVIEKILHCLKSGCQGGWLLDPSDRSILIFTPNQSPQVWVGSDRLPVPPFLPLELTTVQIFDWLKMQ